MEFNISDHNMTIWLSAVGYRVELIAFNYKMSVVDSSKIRCDSDAVPGNLPLCPMYTNPLSSGCTLIVFVLTYPTVSKEITQEFRFLHLFTCRFGIDLRSRNAPINSMSLSTMRGHRNRF
jgi:hypothetical protein